MDSEILGRPDDGHMVRMRPVLRAEAVLQAVAHPESCFLSSCSIRIQLDGMNTAISSQISFSIRSLSFRISSYVSSARIFFSQRGTVRSAF
jgi:hypothetical protein